MNGIIIDGKVYEAVPKGSCRCDDCDLYNKCIDRSLGLDAFCVGLYGVCHGRIIFRFSKELTNKLNDKKNNKYDTKRTCNKGCIPSMYKVIFGL